jgi:hypothetical protein
LVCNPESYTSGAGCYRIHLSQRSTTNTDSHGAGSAWRYIIYAISPESLILYYDISTIIHRRTGAEKRAG